MRSPEVQYLAAAPGGGSGGSFLTRGRADTKSAFDLGHERDMGGSALEDVISVGWTG